jgi:hypothetical protein
MSILSRRVWIFAALIGLAFVLRLYRLDAVPLRGDEAFAVRYWAAPPAQVLRDLADWEPHPFGTFLIFWGWKSLAGDSEFAMRYLPLLGNLIGVAATAALVQHLFRRSRREPSPQRRGAHREKPLTNLRALCASAVRFAFAPAFLAALLWAINPFLIWHAQDARNYALWAGFSPLAMVLFLRAADSNRPRDWVLYSMAQTLALYTFFLEAFFLPVQALYLVIQRRVRPVWRRAVFFWLIIGALLIPWFLQIWLLSGSGYEGTTERSDPARLLSWFLPTMLTGDELNAPWNTLFYLSCVSLITVALLNQTHRRVVFWLLLWAALPALGLLIAASRMSIFHPRYLIAAAPALFALAASAFLSPHRRAAWIALPIIALLGLNYLIPYYRGENPKSGNWPALAVYLDSRAHPNDLIIQVVPDPAFGYYYRDGADEMSLVSGVSVAAQLIDDLNFPKYKTFWLIGRSPEAETYLQDHLQTVSFHTLRGFSIMQFRRWQPSDVEIEIPAEVTFGDVVRLRGYTIQGPDAGSRAIMVLLYWEPLLQTEPDYKVFVHLVGPTNPATGSPIWTQDDHPPLDGFASTRHWEVGSLIRDPYHLLEDASVRLIPAEYTIQIGLYDPETNRRLPAIAANGDTIGDSYPLITLRWPLK